MRISQFTTFNRVEYLDVGYLDVGYLDVEYLDVGYLDVEYLHYVAKYTLRSLLSLSMVLHNICEIRHRRY